MSDAKSPSDLSMDEILKSIQRIIAEDERTSAARPVSTAPVRAVSATEDDDVLELTDALNEDGSIRLLAPVGAREPISPTITADERIAPPEPRDTVPPLRVERVEPVVSPEIRVVSGGAQAAGASVSTVEPEPPVAAAAEMPVAAPPPAGGRSLEDLVSDLLRPMLKTWLDENLPAVVERLARAEVARTVEKPNRGAE